MKLSRLKNQPSHTLAAMTLVLLPLIAGCTCWPFSETTVTERQWKPQTLSAEIKSPKSAENECYSSIYEQHLNETLSLCKASAYSSILDVITGKPVAPDYAKAICAEAQHQADQGIPYSVENRVFNLKPGPDEISACMARKGFKLKEISRKQCYLKIM